MSNLPSQTNDGNSSVIDAEIPSVIKKIPRMPPYFRKRMTPHDVYDPIIVSLGPYHHGKEQLNHAQAIKQVLLDCFVSESTGNNDKSFFHGKILERIRDIRSCYEEVEYDDQALAWLILCDACFLISFLFPNCAASVLPVFDYDYSGIGRVAYMHRDVFLLENQIPFWILKFLLCLQQGIELGPDIWNEIIFTLLPSMISGNLHVGNREYHQSFHILDAYLNLKKVPIKTFPDQHKNGKRILRGCQYRSLTNLRKKGIRFKASNRFSFTSHPLYGQLELPRFLVSYDDFAIYSNLIAYESFNIRTNFYMTSFVSFMKSLIDSPNDVNILREEGILYSDSASDDEIIRMLKALVTFWVENSSVFSELKESIERHCSSKARTWMAELINTYFRSPWTVVALLAAFCVLVLTFLQIIFTIHQK